MATIDITVAASADDASEDSGGTVNIIGNPLLNCDGANEWNGWRFLAVIIPVGATIDVAYMTVQMTSATLDEPDVTIFGNDTATPATFAVVANNLSSRPMTAASVDWAVADAGTGDVNTSSLVSIITELLASYDYSAGLNLALLWRSRANDALRDTSVLSYDGSTTLCARLHIEYTEVAPPAPPAPSTTEPGGTVSALAGAIETAYYVIVNDALGNRLAVIQDYESLTAKRTVNGVGALVFTIPGHYSIDTFKVDGIVELWRAPKGGSWRLEFQQLWFIRERYKLIQGGVRRWQIVAYDLNYLLADPSGKRGRIVAYVADFRFSTASVSDAFTDKSGPADDIIKRVAQENVGSLATDTTRSLATYLSIQAALGAAVSVVSKFERRNVLGLFQELSQASTTAGTYLAFDIVCLTPPNDGSFSIQLQTFTTQRGIDHRQSSNQPILIGPDYGNLEDIILGFVHTDEANYVYAAGQNESANQALTTSSDSARINISPFNRREVFINVSQTADPAIILDEADAALRAGRPFLTLTGTLIDTDQARYGIHWNFGDYITAQIDGYSFDARLDTVQLAFTRDGGERISAQVRAESIP